MERLTYQAGHSIVWRDSVCNFYANKSSIPDELGRVGNYAYRIEAEDMELEGYEVYLVNPYEAASGGHAIVTSSNSTTKGEAWTTYRGESGMFDLAVNYYDVAVGNSSWTISVGGEMVGEWHGDVEYRLGKAPTFYVDGQSAVRVVFDGVEVRKGDEIRIVGVPDGEEGAPVDYVSLLPRGIVD